MRRPSPLCAVATTLGAAVLTCAGFATASSAVWTAGLWAKAGAAAAANKVKNGYDRRTAAPVLGMVAPLYHPQMSES